MLGSPCHHFRKHAGTVKGLPISWVDIPARPFLGLSDGDVDQMLTIVHEHLMAAADSRTARDGVDQFPTIV